MSHSKESLAKEVSELNSQLMKKEDLIVQLQMEKNLLQQQLLQLFTISNDLRVISSVADSQARIATINSEVAYIISRLAEFPTIATLLQDSHTTEQITEALHPVLEQWSTALTFDSMLPGKLTQVFNNARPVCSFAVFKPAFCTTSFTIKTDVVDMIRLFDARLDTSSTIRNRITVLRVGMRFRDIIEAYMSVCLALFLFHRRDPMADCYRYAPGTPVDVDYKDDQQYRNCVVLPNSLDTVKTVSSGTEELLSISQQRTMFQQRLC